MSNAISQLTERKEKLQKELGNLGDSSSDKYYSLREEISKIDESIARSKNELGQLTLQLEQVRADLQTIASAKDSYPRAEEKKRLSDEERILEERLERRRQLYQ